MEDSHLNQENVKSERDPLHDWIARVLCLFIVSPSVILFLISLGLKCYYIDHPENPHLGSTGLWELSIGWLGPLIGVVAWYANPALLLSWIFIWFRGVRLFSLMCSAMAILLALSFLLHSDIMYNESGQRAEITSYGPGYWCWLASMLVMLPGSAYLVWRDRGDHPIVLDETSNERDT